MAKTTARPAPKAPSKPQPKAKPAAKPQAKPAAKPQARSNPRPAPRPQPAGPRVTIPATPLPPPLTPPPAAPKVAPVVTPPRPRTPCGPGHCDVHCPPRKTLPFESPRRLTNPQVFRVFHWVLTEAETIAQSPHGFETLAALCQEATGVHCSGSTIREAMREFGVRQPLRSADDRIADLEGKLEALARELKLVPVSDGAGGFTFVPTEG